MRVTRRHGIVVVLLLCAGLVTGCGGDSSSAATSDSPSAAPGSATPGEAPASVAVTSDAFTDGGDIPVESTCDGDQTSPPLAWKAGGSGATPGAWALVVDDPDAPGDTFVHWVVLDIPPATRSLAAGEDPPGTQLANSTGSASYAGPCPPSGTHHYRFTVYALPSPTGLSDDTTTDDALAEVRSSATAQGTLVGLYSRGS
jgi:Raf kinase inhibitor-like YbhB/YbcL family protein